MKFPPVHWNFAYNVCNNPPRDKNTELTWNNIRQLTGYGDNTFQYGADGIRCRKNNIYYTRDGERILIEHNADTGRSITYLYGEKGVVGFSYRGSDYYYRKNLFGDVVAIYNTAGEEVATYKYDAWGKNLSCEDEETNEIKRINPFRYRSYYYDVETKFYYLNSRYYDPEIGRFLNADSPDYLGEGNDLNNYNLFAYCGNNPIMYSDSTGHSSFPNWAKWLIGAITTVAAVAVTFATGGATLPILIGVAVSTIGGAAISAISHRIATGSWEGAGKAALDGAANGFMIGGLCALGYSVIGGAVRTIKNAKSGITIGKMGTFEDVAALTKTRHYPGLKEFSIIKKFAGQKAAEAVGWWQNKCVVKGVMALKGAIYDCGGALTGAYAKEVALTKGYQYLYNVWLM